MKKILVLAGLVFIPGVAVIAATPLTESTFTEIVREARVVIAADKSVVTPQTNMVFHAPDRVRTGVASRVEMTAPDKTITRIGANTIFTFETGGRDLLLEKGSLLFHAPAGVGGGTIRYHGTAAAVLGTTMICVVLPDGSFKVMDLEGEVKVTLANGQFVVLKSGQMIVIPADGNEFREMEVFGLEKVLSRLLLVVGFSQPLASLPLIQTATAEQIQAIANGSLKFLVGFNQAVFGLDYTFRDMDPSLPHFDDMKDNTLMYISPVQPGIGWPRYY